MTEINNMEKIQCNICKKENVSDWKEIITKVDSGYKEEKICKNCWDKIREPDYLFKEPLEKLLSKIKKNKERR